MIRLQPCFISLSIPFMCVHPTTALARLDKWATKCSVPQITAIILMPSFPGWLAPMHFNPIRFEEFLSFAITVCGTWVGASLLVGGYKSNATSDLPTALARVSFTWLVSQPVAAAQLVLVTAAEGRSLVGASDFASKLPLAATGNTSVIPSCTLASLCVITLQEH